MKKFLSVLLALAVAFTFTFGSTMSAFAATTPETDAANAVKVIESLTPSYASTPDSKGEYVEIYGYVKDSTTAEAGANISSKYVKNAKGLFEPGPASANGGETTYTKSTDTYKVYVEQLNAYTAEAKTAAAALVYAEGTYGTTLTGKVIASPADLGQFIIDNYGDKAAVAQLALDKAELATLAKTASTADFATDDEIATITIDKTTYTKKSSKAIADYIVEDLSKAITDENTALVATVQEAYDAYTTINGYFSNAISGTGAYDNPYKLKKNAKYRTYSYETGSYDWTNASLKTTADKATDDAEKNQQIQTSEAYLSKVITNTKKDEDYAANQADWNAYLDAYKTAYTWLIENKDVTFADPSTATVKAYIANSKLADNVYQASRAIAAVPTLKAMTEDGKNVYDAEVLDTALENLLFTVYSKSIAGDGTAPNNAYDSNYSYTYSVTYFDTAKNNGLTVARKAQAKATVTSLVDTHYNTTDKVEYNTYNSNEYYELEWAKIAAAVDAYCAAIDAATTELDITAAENAFALVLNNTPTKSLVDGYFTSGKLKKVYDEEIGKLDNYKTYLINSASATNPLVITETVNYVWYATKNARTNDEITALFNDAKAVYDTNKTDSEWKEAAAAVVAKIAALPAKADITTADKEAIQEANDAYNALASAYQKYVSNKTTLTNAISAVNAKEVESIYYMAQKMPAYSTVTIADKDAVKAYIEAMEAYDDTTMYTSKTDYASALTAADRLLDRIETLELAAITDAINAIPSLEKITADNKAQIEEVRKAYDAFVAEYAEDYAEDVDTLGTLYESKLANAEKALAAAIEALPKYTDVNAKADLLDMARKLTIWRTSKTSIRVTAVGTVANIKDNGYTVQYKFYKKAPGATSYKLVKTTSSNKYTYTNLKKGTNKFQVKVVVKDADGKVVASKWTYYRAAKVK